MASVVEYVEYPLRGEESTETLIFGALLLLFGFLLLPLVFVFGYVVRTVRTSSEGTAEPPRFDDWHRLFAAGLYPWVLAIFLPVSVYLAFDGRTLTELVASMAFRPHALLFIPFEAMMAVIQVVMGPPPLDGSAQGGLGMAVYGFFFVVSISLVFAYWYLAGAAIVTYISTERVTAAIDTSMLAVATDREHASLWVVSGLTVAFVMTFGGVLADTIPIVGHAFSAVVLFYATVVVAGVFGDRMASIETSRTAEALEGAAGSAEQRARPEEEVELAAPELNEKREKVDPRSGGEAGSVTSRPEEGGNPGVAQNTETGGASLLVRLGRSLLFIVDKALFGSVVLFLSIFLALLTMEGLFALRAGSVPMPLEDFTQFMFGVSFSTAKPIAALLFATSVVLKTGTLLVKVGVSAFTAWRPPEYA